MFYFIVVPSNELSYDGVLQLVVTQAKASSTGKSMAWAKSQKS